MNLFIKLRKRDKMRGLDENTCLLVINVKKCTHCAYKVRYNSENLSGLLIIFANSFDPDQDRHNDLDPNRFTL